MKYKCTQLGAFFLLCSSITKGLNSIVTIINRPDGTYRIRSESLRLDSYPKGWTSVQSVSIVMFVVSYIQRIEIRCYDMGRPDGTMTSCVRALDSMYIISYIQRIEIRCYQICRPYGTIILRASALDSIYFIRLALVHPTYKPI